MEFRLEKWYRPLAGCGLFLLLAGLAGAWYADEAEKPPLVLHADSEKKEVRKDTTEVIGLKQANEHRELRNPFSLLHESEQEGRKNALATEQLEALTDAKPHNLPLPPNESDGQSLLSDGQMVTLCGIVEGGGLRLALLRVGNNTVTAGVGETAVGWQVTNIGASAVTLERGGQVLNLPLVTSSEAGAK